VNIQRIALISVASLVLAVGVSAQTLKVEPVDPAAAAAAPAASAAAPAAPAAATGGIQSQNIFQIKPDASTDPKYAEQTNAQRGQVQPGNNAPMWRQVQSGIAGYTSLPGREAGVLIQTTGEWWRQMRNGPITQWGGWALVAVLLAIGAFYSYRGKIIVEGGNTGRKIERFTPAERLAHWSVAISFSVLAISGLVMLFGRYLIQPIIGSTLFGWLTYALKNLHNFVGPVFAVALIFVFVKFVKDNFPRKGDLAWLLKGGGLLSGKHVSSHRFNAGEKVWFWLGVFFLGILVTASGFVLNMLVPGFDYTRGNMQLAHIIHAVVTLVMMAFAMGHIYIGTLGTEGAYQGMRTGYVDEAWAKQHHDEWYDDIKAGKIPLQRSSEGHATDLTATPAKA
jgi:formate dehydrogenase subunit gamma